MRKKRNRNEVRPLAMNIRLGRMLAGHTQESFADAAGISRPTYAKYEEDRSSPYPEQIIIFCDLIGVEDVRAFITDRYLFSRHKVGERLLTQDEVASLQQKHPGRRSAAIVVISP